MLAIMPQLLALSLSLLFTQLTSVHSLSTSSMSYLGFLTTPSIHVLSSIFNRSLFSHTRRSLNVDRVQSTPTIVTTAAAVCTGDISSLPICDSPSFSLSLSLLFRHCPSFSVSFDHPGTCTTTVPLTRHLFQAIFVSWRF